MSEHILATCALIIALGITAQWTAWRLGLPSILLLLVFGFAAGPVCGWLVPDDLLGELLMPLVSLAVGLILFEGGLTLKVRELKSIGGVLRNLITIGALITWVGRPWRLGGSSGGIGRFQLSLGRS
jgi:NhaP-type Na+/H+ or K+/H+ antiporter